MHLFAVLEHERDRVREEQRKADDDHVKPRLPVLADLLRVDAPARKEAHGVMLRGADLCQRARDEPWLPWRHERAAAMESEGGTGRICGEGTQSGATEVAVVARQLRMLGRHGIAGRMFEGVGGGGILRPGPARSRVAADENAAFSGSFDVVKRDVFYCRGGNVARACNAC